MLKINQQNGLFTHVLFLFALPSLGCSFWTDFDYLERSLCSDGKQSGLLQNHHRLNFLPESAPVLSPRQTQPATNKFYCQWSKILAEKAARPFSFLK